MRSQGPPQFLRWPSARACVAMVSRPPFSMAWIALMHRFMMICRICDSSATMSGSEPSSRV
jgi:hypothetical protein